MGGGVEDHVMDGKSHHAIENEHMVDGTTEEDAEGPMPMRGRRTTRRQRTEEDAQGMGRQREMPKDPPSRHHRAARPHRRGRWRRRHSEPHGRSTCSAGPAPTLPTSTFCSEGGQNQRQHRLQQLRGESLEGGRC